MISYPKPVKLKLDREQYLFICKALDQLLDVDSSTSYGNGVIEKMILSMTIDVAQKFKIDKFQQPKKHYTKTLKFHEAYALLSVISYLLEIHSYNYYRAILHQVREMLDKKVQ